MTPDDAIPTESVERLRARVTLSTSFAWIVVLTCTSSAASRNCCSSSRLRRGTGGMEHAPPGVGAARPKCGLVDDDGRACAPGTLGELRVRGRGPGVLLADYHRNPNATTATLRDGWLYTGDLAQADAEGRFSFHGRKKDSLRRRGENVSAWEVERVVDKHPQVVETALVGVRNEIGDEDLKLFAVRRSPTLTEADLIAWCMPRMAAFQVPRFVVFVDEYRKTPTQRIQKQFLSRSVDDCWDRER